MATKKEKSSHAPEVLVCYDKLIETLPGIERKGATMPYTSLNGHMFSLLDKDGTFALRLPEDVLEQFLKKYKTKLHETYGTVLKEYAVVPEKLFKNTKELAPYFKQSVDYIKTLKPKATKR